MSFINPRWFVFLVLIPFTSCTSSLEEEKIGLDKNEKALTSVEAEFLDFDWDGEIVGFSGSTNQSINEQLKWTIGQLNGAKSVGRIDHVELSNVSRSGSTITYHAKMVVAWGKSTVPSTYTFHLPRSTSYSGLNSFLAKYKGDCMGDTHGEEPTLGDAWYFYRPNNSACNQDAQDTASFVATLSPNSTATTGVYPEYHKVWEDDTLRIVAIFGKNDENGPADDVGYLGFNRMVYQVHNMLRNYDLETYPADLEIRSGSRPSEPAPAHTDVELRATLPDGKRVVVNIFSVPAIRSAGNAFYARYEGVSAAADFISYNGHSGLGSNIRTLATRGKWVRDQYTIVLMNGCTTFAYVDSALANAHANVNPDDATGDKHLDMFTNAMPSYFAYNAQGVMAIARALMSYNNPKTYEQILSGFHYTQVALVSGEEDNVYSPGMTDDTYTTTFYNTSIPSKTWKHYGPFHVADGGVIKAYTGGNHYAADGVLNDADLYVRRGARPTSASFNCSSTTPHATEQCVLVGGGDYYVSVFGWTENVNADFDITITYQPEGEEYCGDNAVVSPEVCDGNTRDCTELNEMYHGGQAACNADCSGWEESTCLYCGDGQIQGEVCDGDTVSCADLDARYLSGEATCNGTCSGYDLSACVEDEDLVVKTESGSLGQDDWVHFGPFSHSAGEFKVEMTGSGDADLYVRHGAAPTKDDHNCRPYKSGSAETCTLSGPGQYYVAVNGFKSANTFALTITYRTSSDVVCGDGLVTGDETCDGNSISCTDISDAYTGGQAPCNDACNGFDESNCPTALVDKTVNQSGSLAETGWDHFGPFVHLEGPFGVVMTGTGDMDLYVRKEIAPTPSKFDCRSWGSDSNETCSLSGADTYYVSVYGYKAGNYDLTITYRSGE